MLEALETVVESEEEMRQWEEEQINKGVKIIQGTQQPVNYTLPTNDHTRLSGYLIQREKFSAHMHIAIAKESQIDSH